MTRELLSLNRGGDANVSFDRRRGNDAKVAVERTGELTARDAGRSSSLIADCYRANCNKMPVKNRTSPCGIERNQN